MKIAVVSHDSFWPVKGGGGIRVFWIVKQMIEAGHDVTIIAPFENTKGIKEEFPNIKIKNLGEFSRFDKNKEIRYFIQQSQDLNLFISHKNPSLRNSL